MGIQAGITVNTRRVVVVVWRLLAWNTRLVNVWEVKQQLDPGEQTLVLR